MGTLEDFDSTEKFSGTTFYGPNILKGINYNPAITPDGKKIFYIDSTHATLYDTEKKKVVYKGDDDFTRDYLTSKFLSNRLLFTSANGVGVIYDILETKTKKGKTRIRGLEKESIPLITSEVRLLGDEENLNRGDAHIVFYDEEDGHEEIAICRLPKLTNKPLGESLHLECQYLDESTALDGIQVFRIDEKRWLLVGTNEEEHEHHWLLTLEKGEIKAEWRDPIPIKKALEELGSWYPFVYDIDGVFPLGTFWSEVPRVRQETLEFLQKNTPAATDILGVIVRFIL